MLAAPGLRSPGDELIQVVTDGDEAVAYLSGQGDFADRGAIRCRR
jgi:hypothetical protein